MDLIVCGPLPAACRRWSGWGGGRWVVACKATFRLEPGPPRLSSRQVPISGVVGGGIGERGGVDDLVPCKGSPEVLIVGLADAGVWPGPRRLEIGREEMRLPRRPNEAWTLGPMRPGDPRRAVFALDFDEAMRAWRDGEIVPGVDPRFFNATPPAQWVDTLAPGGTLTLWNVDATSQRLEVQVPDVWPRAVVERAGTRRELKLQADTLLLNLDERIGTLTFRLSLLETAGDELTVFVDCEAETAFVDVTLDLPPDRDAAARPPLPFERIALGASDPRAEPFDPEATVHLAPREAALLPLATCARLDAELSLHPGEAAALLERGGHTKEDFQRSERHWAREIRQESRAGRSTQMVAYDEAFASRLEELRGPVMPDDYAALVVARERGRLESEAEARSIPPPCIPRVERVWVRRLSTDAALFDEVERAIRRARSRDTT